RFGGGAARQLARGGRWRAARGASALARLPFPGRRRASRRAAKGGTRDRTGIRTADGGAEPAADDGRRRGPAQPGGERCAVREGGSGVSRNLRALARAVRNSREGRRAGRARDLYPAPRRHSDPAPGPVRRSAAVFVEDGAGARAGTGGRETGRTRTGVLHTRGA